MTKCPDCNDTGERDSGGSHPWGEPVLLPCDCKDAEIGREWRENSSLEKWFPITAERLAALEAENAALKRDLQYARDGLIRGRTRMREDNERLAEALSDLLAAHAMRASCQAGLVKRCKCMPCATARARDALGPNAEVTGLGRNRSNDD